MKSPLQTQRSVYFVLECYSKEDWATIQVIIPFRNQLIVALYMLSLTFKHIKYVKQMTLFSSMHTCICIRAGSSERALCNGTHIHVWFICTRNQNECVVICHSHHSYSAFDAQSINGSQYVAYTHSHFATTAFKCKLCNKLCTRLQNMWSYSN